MAKKENRSVRFTVSTDARPRFDEAMVAYAFSPAGELRAAAQVKACKFVLDLSERELARARVFLAPRDEGDDGEPTLASLERRGAYEPVLADAKGGLLRHIEIPGTVIDHWRWCLCWVRGQVLRWSDNRGVCDARVHICEVDKVPRWILELPELEILRLRDDLIEVLREPPIPVPPVDPVVPEPLPGPDPAPFERPLYRLDPEPEVSIQQLGRASAGSEVAFNPQPEPPARLLKASRSIDLDLELRSRLLSTSPAVVRATLAENWRLVYPWLCIWPHWWRFRCDEIKTVTTGASGRFETLIGYPCDGDRPDLYFWVEYDFGSGFETVYKPPIACNTYWDYTCGSKVTIRINDDRLPGCDDEPDLPGCQVVVNSIGNDIAVNQVRTSGADEGLCTYKNQASPLRPFGGTLEMRVDFSRTQLITNKNIPYYRWSYRRLSEPDGTDLVPAGTWTRINHSVHRHYKVGTSYPADLMGPLPPVGPGNTPELFRIRPKDPPVGDEWIVLNQHIDLTTGDFRTASLPGVPASGPTAGPPAAPAPDDLAAGRYELKLELFDGNGDLVKDWGSKGIDLRITDQEAPFGTGTVTTSPAPAYNRILDGGKTDGFRMVVRVDNNRCFADIKPVAGDLTPDPQCGFHTYDPGDDAGLSFEARHPNGFATYAFNTIRANGGPIGAASTSGVAGEVANSGGFGKPGPFTYQKDVRVSDLLGPCANAAFAERLDIEPMATNGYSTLHGYRHSDTAAFALAMPCPPCECEEEQSE